MNECPVKKRGLGEGELYCMNYRYYTVDVLVVNYMTFDLYLHLKKYNTNML